MNDPLALGPVTRGFDPYFVHEARGFGANNVNRLLVHVPAIFPYQLPVLFSVYVAFRFIKMPDVIGIGFVTFRVVTLVVERLEFPVTLRAPPKIEAAFRVVTLVVERLEFPVTFKFVPKIDSPFRVVTLVVERFEVPVTFKFVPKIDAPFRVVTLVVERFEVPVTLVVERFAIPVTSSDPPMSETAFIIAAFPLV